MSADEKETFLQHYGKKGMRWGSRKASGQRTYDTKKLSNTELKAVINRMQLEQQYKNLNVSGQSKKKKFATDVTTEAGKKVAIKLLTNLAIGGVKYSALKTKTKMPKVSKALRYLATGGK